MHCGVYGVLLACVSGACAAPAGSEKLTPPLEPLAASTGTPQIATTPPLDAGAAAPAPALAVTLRLEALAPAPAADPAPVIEIKFPIVAQQILLPKVRDYLVRLKIENWPLSATGAGVEIALDDHPPRRVLEPNVRLGSLTHDGRDPGPGEHAVFVWAVRAGGELARPAPGASRAPFAAVRFWAGAAKGPLGPEPPRVILAAPRGNLNGDAAADHAVVDFLPQAVDFETAPLLVKIQAAGAGAPPSAAELRLSAWQPVAVRGLPNGDWSITLEHGSVRTSRVISVNRDLAPALVR